MRKRSILKGVIVLSYGTGGILLILGVLLMLVNQPALANQPAQDEDQHSVIPTLLCARHNEDGTFTALFGYQNNNPAPVEIPIGDNNHIRPAPEDRGQPVVFQPGEEDVAFKVIYREDDRITWTLTGPDGSTHSVTASDGTRRCLPANPIPTPTEVENIEPTSTPTEQPTNPPAATQIPTSQPTATLIPTPQPPSPTLVPTPVPQGTLPPPPGLSPSQPVGLIPVTGASSPDLRALNRMLLPGFLNWGLILVGLGAALHGIWLKTRRP